MLIEFTAQIG